MDSCKHNKRIEVEVDYVVRYIECIDCGEQVYNDGIFPKDYREIDRDLYADASPFDIMEGIK
jgi:hypothetical protein